MNRFFITLNALIHFKAACYRAVGAFLLICAVLLLALRPAHAAGSGTLGDPFTSMADAYEISSGRYYFDLGSGTFQADVDNSSGGGWILALQYVHQGGTNPALNIIGAGADLPVTSSAALGTDESADLTRWGHAGNAAMSQFTGDIELRWYADTGAHGRVIHFRSTIGDSYVRTGTGNFSGINSSFTALSGHTANIPGTAGGSNGSQGDYALTNFPFYEGASRHWGVAGAPLGQNPATNGFRWEVDDFPNSSANNTRHQVWVRSAPLTVTNENDSGAGSLRQAILDANADPDRDYIRFDIPGSFAETITLSTALPAITDAGVIIDGTTEGGTTCRDLWAGSAHTLIMNVVAPNSSTDVFTVSADDVTIKGLAIQGGNRGIFVNDGFNRFTAQCNYIGFSSTGAWSSGGTANVTGILTGNGNGHLIGGSGATEGNVISGNTSHQIYVNKSHDTVIRGNFMGTNGTGSAKVDASAGGEGIRLDLSVDNLTVDNNLISGLSNLAFAAVTGTNITFTNNYWGTDRAGTSVLTTSASDHIHFNGTAANIQNITVGTPGNGNLFGGNRRGVHIANGGTNVVIQGNTMGVSLDGSTALNLSGSAITLEANVDGAVVGGTGAGAGNVMANTGISAVWTEANDVTILGNSMYANTNDAINLRAGVTDALNRPTVEHVAVAGGTDATPQISADLPAGDYRVELFKVDTPNGAQQGDARTYLGSFDITHGGTGTEYFSDTIGPIAVVSPGDIFTATVTEKPTPTTFASTSPLANNATGAASMKVYTTNGNGAGSLRDAITVTNSRTGIDTIEFDIPGVGPHTIALGSNLPAITDAGVTIDGTTQSGASCGDLWAGGGHTLMVRIASVASGHGMSIAANDATIKGLSITGGQIGIVSDPGFSGLTVQCNYIGIAPDGTAAGQVDGLGRGLRIQQNADVTIGGPNGTDGNVIGASNDDGIILWNGGTNISVQNNFIGTDPTGMATRGNTNNGLEFLGSGAFTVAEISNNLISGNGSHEINIENAATLTGVSGDILIQGNYIGVDRTGNTALTSGGAGFAGLAGTSMTGATIGGTGAGEGNVISGNSGNGIGISTGSTYSNLTFLGNHIGVGADGTTSLGNGVIGLNLNNISNVTVGNGAASGRNIISGNGEDGIFTTNSTSLTIDGNYIGVGSDGITAIGNGQDGIVLQARNTQSGHANAVVSDNVISDNGQNGVDISSYNAGIIGASSTITFTGNKVGVGADGTTPIGNTQAGIKNTNVPGTILVGGSGASDGNIIAYNGNNGLFTGALTGANLAIIGNSIHSNTGLGIDLNSDGVTVNDTGDADTGPNDLLNFPVLTAFGADGTTDVSFDLTLDVPADANGYRIDFFKNTVLETYGEGEIHLGAVDISHTGGNLRFASNFTANAAVSVGDNISATATRKTSGVTYDITSEFSETIQSVSKLIVTDTGDTNTIGTLRYAINHVNAVAGDDAITFNIAGAGPHVISPTSTLPTISDAGVTIDGLTQSGAACGQLTTGTQHTLMIQLDGTNAGLNTEGLKTSASGVTMRGLSITNFDGHGIEVIAGGDSFTAECLYVGVAPDGTTKGSNAKNNGHQPALKLNAVSAGTVRNSLVSGNDNDAIDYGIRFQSVTGGTIEGNILGLNAAGTAALGNSKDGIYLDGTTSGVTIGGLTPETRNVSSGNGEAGIDLQANTSSITILGNYLGLNRTGTSAIANGGNGINVSGSTAVTIGDGTAAGRNVISGNGSSNQNGIRIYNGASNITIRGNYIGLAADGVTAAPNIFHGIDMDDATTTNIVIGGTGAGDGNVVSSNSDRGLALSNGTNVTVLGNLIGVAADGTTPRGNGTQGITVNGGITAVQIGDGTATGANIIAHNAAQGIQFQHSGTEATILANRIFDNGGIGIDLNDDGVTTNDAGDGDAGHNDLLNYPVINSFAVDGTTGVEFDFNLDVPANANGYRIDFFKNTAADASGYGEGETHLGAVDVSHTGGNLQFVSSFTANTGVSAGDIISATATRKTSGVTYDITSEFSASVAAVLAQPLVVTSTADTNTFGTLRYAINHANANPSDDAITFNIAGAGPHVINLSSNLPIITDDNVSIDGTSQPGASCGNLWAGTPHTLMIQIDGGGNTTYGIQFDGAGTSVSGLSLTTLGAAYVASPTSNGSTLTCSYVGLAPDGTAGGNTDSGLYIDGANATIGGLTAGEGNVISSNRYGIMSRNGMTNLNIRGNFVGTDPTGTAARANTVRAINHISGTGSWGEIRNNLISGNAGPAGIALEGDTITAADGNIEIAGNYIGVDRTGNTALPNEAGILFGTISSVGSMTIGGTAAADRNVISGNTNDGISFEGISGVTILGNYIGLGADGTTAVGNGVQGIKLDSASNITIGNGTASGRNVISGNAKYGLHATGTTTVTVDDSFFGTNAAGTAAIANLDDGIALTASANATIQNSVISGNGGTGTGFGIAAVSSSTSIILGNKIGVGVDGTTAIPNLSTGIAIENSATSQIGDGTLSGANIIAHNSIVGISTFDTNQSFAILANSIHSNGGLGIDLSRDGVTANDSGDADTGPNDLLNFPVLNSFSADGTTGVEFDFNLDVPANANGYRIDFFKNTVLETYGEGEIHLGSVDVTHTGGNLQFISSFTANAAVSVGDNIAATATRKTSGVTYDITSEFSETVQAIAFPSPLVITSTADTNTLGTLRYAINHANANPSDDAITFNIAGAGPHTITLGNDLPTITDAGVTIDGTTQSGASCGQLTTGTQHTLMIHIDGTGAAADTTAFTTIGSGTELRGMAITNFDGYAFNAGAAADNFVAECLYLGVAPDGVTKGPNAKTNTVYPSGRMVGSINPTVRNNLISGNDDDSLDYGVRFFGTTGGVIEGNIIGLNANGTAALGNAAQGIWLDDFGGTVASGLTIGGTTAATRNVIAGNGSDGIVITDGSANITVLGNYIGLGIDGTTALGNGAAGIEVNVASTVAIGDGTASGRNVIASNTSHGVLVDGVVTGLTIDGNYIGTASDGATGRGNGGSGVFYEATVTSDGDIIRNNVLSANTQSGLEIFGPANNLSVTGNLIGTNATGTAALGNTERGIYSNTTLTGFTLGGTSVAARNIISGNTLHGVTMDTLNTASILGNYVGVGADGATAIANGQDGVRISYSTNLTFGNGAASGRNIVSGNTANGLNLLRSSTSASIRGNYFGLAADGSTTVGNGSRGLVIRAGPGEGGHNGALVDGNIASGNGQGGIDITSGTAGALGNSSSVTVTNNYLGVAADGMTARGNTDYGIKNTNVPGTIVVGGTGNGNIIAHNIGEGVYVGSVIGTTMAVIGNSIYGNTDLGIDLDNVGVTANDSGDGDTGPNELLNFPVIGLFAVDGSSSVSYDFTLDVPIHGNGYRVDFFKSTSADPSGYGEGETHLGSVDVAGSGSYSGSFTALATVAVGEVITATTTRRTASSYDITSEFSLSYSAFTANPAELAATKTVSVVDDGLISGDDTVAIPGATLRYAITIRNDGAGMADVDTTVVVDQIPTNGALKVVDFNGAGGAGPVGIAQGSPASGLTYNYSGLSSGLDDLEFSNDNGATWTYVPSNSGDGTDPNVTHIRISPTGSFNANGGTPPTLSIQYDVILF